MVPGCQYVCQFCSKKCSIALVAIVRHAGGSIGDIVLLGEGRQAGAGGAEILFGIEHLLPGCSLRLRVLVALLHYTKR